MRFIIHFLNWLFNFTYGLVLELVDSLDLKSSGIYSRGGSSPPEATKKKFYYLNFIFRLSLMNLKLSQIRK